MLNGKHDILLVAGCIWCLDAYLCQISTLNNAMITLCGIVWRGLRLDMEMNSAAAISALDRIADASQCDFSLSVLTFCGNRHCLES